MDENEINEPKAFKCRICLKPFIQRRFLKRHLIIRHSIQIRKSDGTVYIYRKPTTRKDRQVDVPADGIFR